MKIVDKIQEGATKSGDQDRLVTKPDWVFNGEQKLANAIPLHPNVISAFKLLVVIPLLLLALKQLGTLPNKQGLVIGLFILFSLLDYLDGVVARYKNLATPFGTLFDRVTDYPILVVSSLFCIKILPKSLLFLKLFLDLILIILYFTGKGNTENRIRTGLNYTTLFALVIVSQGWGSPLLTPDVVVYLLLINISFTLIIILFNINFLQKRFIADALSASNLLCGIFSILYASKGRLEISLLFLMLGAAFDGFDGAAARKFGSTRFGVYSDDIADGVNYGIAPGFAIYFTLGGIEGIFIGAMFTIFTIGRLIYFTLNKANSDPNFFCGVPSTVGALVTLCSLILFKQQPALIGFMVGMACVQMISFDTLYQHLGRALSANRRIIYGMPLLILIMLVGHFFVRPEVPVIITLVATLVYGFIPTFTHFYKIIDSKTD